jgi:hypothetical protein
LPTSLDHLSRQQKLELKAALEERERRRCARDAEYWLFKYAKSRDEHDPSVGSGLFVDEGGFQSDLAALVGAAKPILVGGGRLDM